MTKSITTLQKCAYMRNGAQIWLDAQEAENLGIVLDSMKSHTFIKIPSTGERINTADLVGVFKPETIRDITRRKNGQWQCDKGSWHDRGQICECLSDERILQIKKSIIEHKQKYGLSSWPLGTPIDFEKFLTKEDWENIKSGGGI